MAPRSVPREIPQAAEMCGYPLPILVGVDHPLDQLAEEITEVGTAKRPCQPTAAITFATTASALIDCIHTRPIGQRRR